MTGWTLHWKTSNATGSPVTRYCLVAIADPDEAIALAQREIGGDPVLELGGALSDEQLARRNVQRGEMLVLGRSSRRLSRPRTKARPVA